jgi:cellulose synthase/poly-beta-1,6-N-acetylglucosamine synthase-like glycosyltransferase
VSIDTVLFLVHALLMVAAAGLSVLVVVLLTEVVAGLPGPLRAAALRPVGPCSYVIVIPAHDEVGTIEQTLASVLQQIDADGSVLVVADNCTDETAAVSAAAGAKVITRNDPSRRGKGYALDFAMRHLAASPPDVVVILDADCIPTPGTLHQLVASCHRLGQPVQARYEILQQSRSTDPTGSVGLLAWRVKNTLRPTGLTNLGLPCLLMGTGMAFPWPVLAKCNLETGHLVEDMVLGLELTAAGHPPRFLPEICVQSALPPSVEGQKSQRTRWETGHLQVIAKMVPGLLLRGLLRGNVPLVALALDAAVLPLALLALFLIATAALSALVALAGGSSWALLTTLGASAGALVALVLSWHKMGRDLISPSELVLLPRYAIAKLSLYARALTGQKIQWIRSKRN